ncbi:MAG TPA: hypothetical protein ENL04_04350 [Sulfuricurvum sp.]|nr:hypothetical protein [Sulfuricurvum sp.]
MLFKCKLFSILSLLLAINTLSAASPPAKFAIKTNGILVLNDTPSRADSFSEIFENGVFYGRLRTNNFYFRWNNEDPNHATHLISALGASVIYRSAIYSDFEFGTALYASQAFFDDVNDPVDRLKSGKDALSRFEYVNTGNKAMAVLGQGYLCFHGIPSTQVIVGRQLVESFYTKSNDTKMIPNTFDGAVVSSTALPSTTLQIGYLSQQKLRDHTQAHAVLMYGDANSSSAINPQWSENDDSAMHRGLTYSALKAAGKPTDAPLVIADMHHRSVKNFKLDAAFFTVPKLLSSVMAEANYAFKLNGGVSLTPGVRYIRQFDQGAGSVGGASYTDDATGYHDPDSLDAQMVAARLVLRSELYKFNLAMTYVLDEADLIAPWRGFPTSGYTRSMGIYNWRANTKSYRFEVQRNANAQGLYTDLFIQASVLYTNADERKTGFHNLDELYYYIGFVQNLPQIPPLQWRLRAGYAQFLNNDDSKYNYLDMRFEANYLF